MIKCLIGSQNYGLDGPESDKDYYIFEIPKFDDMYHNRHLVREVKREDGIDFHKDIRSLVNMINKASFNQLEILWSKEVIISDPWCNALWDYMIVNRDSIGKANIKRLHSSTMGEMKRRINDLVKGKYTEGTKHLFEKHGYDTKNAMHAYRLYYTFVEFLTSDFNSLQFELPKYDLLGVKNGKHKLVSVVDELMQYSIRLEYTMKCDHYIKNEVASTELDKRIMQVVKELC